MLLPQAAKKKQQSAVMSSRERAVCSFLFVVMFLCFLSCFLLYQGAGSAAPCMGLYHGFRVFSSVPVISDRFCVFIFRNLSVDHFSDAEIGFCRRMIGPVKDPLYQGICDILSRLKLMGFFIRFFL